MISCVSVKIYLLESILFDPLLFGLKLGGAVAFSYLVHLSSHCPGANGPRLSKYSVIFTAGGMQNRRYFGRV